MKSHKKSPFLRLTALLLVSILLLSAFAGCAGDKPVAESTGAPVTQTAEPAGTPAAQATEFDPSGYTPNADSLKESTGKITDLPVYTVRELTADDPRLDAVVASCGSRDLTNRDLQMFFYMQFFGFMSQYGSYASYFGLDPEKPLAEQASMEEGMSWEQYFLDTALSQFHQFSAIYDKAAAEGHQLSEEEENNLAEIFAGLPEDAKKYGYDSVDDYVAASFGPGVTQKNYEDFMRIYFTAVSYENKMYDSITWTDEDLLAFAKAHPDEYGELDNTVNNVMVRHILIQPEKGSEGGNQSEQSGETGATVSEEEAKAAARAKAEEILEEFRKDPNEENFAVLAGEYSSDPGSASNGGLYDDVYPGQMVPTFNDWCFEETRQPGDTGIVETDYGYHIMYFVGQTDHAQWKVMAEEEYPMETMTTAIQELMDAKPLFVNYPAIIIAPMPEAEEAAEEAEAAEEMG